MIDSIPLQNPFSEEICDFAEKLLKQAALSRFPKDLVSNHLYGIGSGYFVLDSLNSEKLNKNPSLAELERLARQEKMKAKAKSRILEQLNILADANVTDNDSARAYLNQAAIEIEDWIKIKTEFDQKKEVEFNALKNDFLRG
jgi:cellulose biosynthesis protein BcsQ